MYQREKKGFGVGSVRFTNLEISKKPELKKKKEE